MSAGVYVVVRCAVLFIDVIDLAMFVRAIMSWIFIENQTKFGAFLYVVTEPVIMPVRALCEKFGWFRGVPVDMPFFITVILLLVVRVLLLGTIGV